MIAKKIFKKHSEENVLKAKRELTLLAKCQHTNVVTLIQISSISPKIFEINMEYIPLSLFNLIQLIKCNERDIFSKQEIVSF